jgi:hypothetical protein
MNATKINLNWCQGLQDWGTVVQGMGVGHPALITKPAVMCLLMTVVLIAWVIRGMCILVRQFLRPMLALKPAVVQVYLLMAKP